MLQQLFGEVIIPYAVRDELLANKNATFIDRLFSHSWLKTKAVSQSSLLNDLLLTIDRGEAGAIALALELSATYLLIDEQRGKKITKQLQLNPFGLLGLFLFAKRKGVIQSIKPWINKLVSATSFRHTQKLINAVPATAGET